jgi:16S rRNA processing protein RimM
MEAKSYLAIMNLPTDYTLVGVLQKPHGLLGDMKVRPETFDFDRHESLDRVFARDRKGEITALKVRATRADSQFWYLRFEGYRTPEALNPLCGQELLIDSAERLELPEGMVYFSELPGMRVRDEQDEEIGEILEVREAGPTEYLAVRTSRGEILIPWNDHFVRKIDKVTRIVHMDLSGLRGVVL